MLQLLKTAIESWERDPVGMYGWPLLIATLGSVFVFIVTALLRKWVERKQQTAMRQLFFTSLLWVRWFSIGLLFLYTLSVTADNLAETITTFSNGKYTQLAVRLQKFDSILTSWIKTAARVFFVCIGTIWLTQFLENAILVVVDRYALLSSSDGRRALRSQTLTQAASYAVRSLMIVVLFLTVLQIVGLSITPLLATAGVASVAIGFGAQSIVKDVLAGFFILLEDQFAVGDAIAVDTNLSGRVESMTLRVTRLRNDDGELIVVPNSEIRTVRNKTSGWSQVNLQITVGYETDLDKATAILKEEAENVRKMFPQHVVDSPDVIGFDKMLDSALSMRLFIKTSSVGKGIVEREMIRRVLERFRKEKISIPFPQRELWVHQIKD